MSKTKKVVGKEDLSDVLFQRLGKNWYVFAEVDGNILYTKLKDGLDPIKTPLSLFQILEDSESLIETA